MRLDTASLTEFFREGISEAQERQKVALSGEAQFYVVNLLVGFFRTEKLFDGASGEHRDEPLALTYARALEAEGPNERYVLLKDIGDRSLYVSGFFPESFRRKMIDIDYYIAMGERAYAYVSSITTRDVFSEMFGELSEKFPRLVDVIGEVSEASGVTSDRDLLRLYERWLATKSGRLLEKLKNEGILPVDASTDVLH